MDAVGSGDRGLWRHRVAPRGLRQVESVGRGNQAGEKHMPRIEGETGRCQTSQDLVGQAKGLSWGNGEPWKGLEQARDMGRMDC